MRPLYFSFMTTLRRFLLSGAVLPLAVALSLQCNSSSTGTDPNADLGGSGTEDLSDPNNGNGDGGGGSGGDGGGGSQPDLLPPTLQLTGVSPALGPSTGLLGSTAVVLDVSGANFVSGAQVYIAGQLATTQYVSPTLLKVTLPAKLGTRGLVAVEVRLPDTRSTTRSDLFRYYYGSLSFALQAAKLDVGMAPSAIAIGELNNNNKPDIITANRTGNNVSFALGNADGTFGAVGSAAASMSAMGKPTGLSLGDMDKDGFLDAIVSVEVANTVAVLLNNKTGVLARSGEYSVGMTPQAVVASDLTGDMIPDAISANAGGNNASYLVGAAAGAFGTATTLTPGGTVQGPAALAMADINKDGKPDIVMANQMTNNITVFLWNDTTKTFDFKANYATGANTNPRGIVLGDFAGDGNVDVAVSLSVTMPQLAVLTGDGTGAFGGPTNYTAGKAASDAPLGMASADFDFDGVPDIVTTLSAADYIAILRNRNKTPQAPDYFTSGMQPQAVAVGDLNNDGRPDLAVANTGESKVAILLNTSQ